MKIYEVRNQDSIHYVTSKRAAELMGKRGLGVVTEIKFDLTKKGISEMLNTLGLEPSPNDPACIRRTVNRPPVVVEQPEPENMDEDGVGTREEPEDQFRSDAEADADTLASAGYGTDEDYGHFGHDE